MSTPRPTLQSMPFDVLYEIYHQLTDIRDILSLSQTCQSLRSPPLHYPNMLVNIKAYVFMGGHHTGHYYAPPVGLEDAPHDDTYDTHNHVLNHLFPPAKDGIYPYGYFPYALQLLVGRAVTENEAAGNVKLTLRELARLVQDYREICSYDSGEDRPWPYDYSVGYAAAPGNEDEEKVQAFDRLRTRYVYAAITRRSCWPLLREIPVGHLRRVFMGSRLPWSDTDRRRNAAVVQAFSEVFVPRFDFSVEEDVPGLMHLWECELEDPRRRVGGQGCAVGHRNADQNVYLRERDAWVYQRYEVPAYERRLEELVYGDGDESEVTRRVRFSTTTLILPEEMRFEIEGEGDEGEEKEEEEEEEGEEEKEEESHGSTTVLGSLGTMLTSLFGGPWTTRQ